MPIPEKYMADFEENGIYHVYNRTNNQEKLFLSDENRLFFLRKYKEHLSAYLDTYCWCLLPNHFHFLVRVKSHKQIAAIIKAKEFNDRSLTEKKFLENLCTISELAEHGFKRFFQSYSLAFNKVHQRKGNLFYKPFKRVVVDKEAHFTQAIIYIHANPVKHRIIKDFTTYQWSSWKSYLSVAPTDLLRDEVLDWFGNKEQFIKAHNDLTQYYYESDISIED
jgi:REP element-mobilizing transposase RayT